MLRLCRINIRDMFIMICPLIFYIIGIYVGCSPWGTCFGRNVRNLKVYNTTIIHDVNNQCLNKSSWPVIYRPCMILIAQCMDLHNEHICDVQINNEYETSEYKFYSDLSTYSPESWHYIIYKGYESCNIINDDLHFAWYLGAFGFVMHICLVLAYGNDDTITGYEINN